jgi:hypothetical protein
LVYAVLVLFTGMSRKQVASFGKISPVSGIITSSYCQRIHPTRNRWISLARNAAKHQTIAMALPPNDVCGGLSKQAKISASVCSFQAQFFNSPPTSFWGRAFLIYHQQEDVIIVNIHDKHLLRVGNPRLYDHPYQSPQLPLWEPGEVEWFVIIRADPQSHRRRKKGRMLLLQPPLWKMGDEASG